MESIRSELEEFKFGVEQDVFKKANKEEFEKLVLQVEKKGNTNEIQEIISTMRANFHDDLEILKEGFR